MTLLEKNRRINQLIKNGYLESSDYAYVEKLDKDTIILSKKDGEPCNTFRRLSLQERINDLSRDARRAYFIQEILKAVDIEIDNIETEYTIGSSQVSFIIFYLKKDDTYTFIELCDGGCYYYGDSADSIIVVKMNLDSTHALTYDRIDLNELKYYHADSKISDFTLKIIDQIWSKKDHLNQNDYYEIVAEDSPKNPGSTCSSRAYVFDYNYGEYVSNLDTDKLDKNICKVMTMDRNTQRIYYL